CHHLPRALGRAAWRSHVQHENGTAITEHRALEDERYRLGNSHEIACNLRVSDSDRSTASDLARESRDDTAGRAEHVAKAHGHELCSRMLPCDCLQVNFP